MSTQIWLYVPPLEDAGKTLEPQGDVTILNRVWQVNIKHPLFKPSLEKSGKGYSFWFGERDYIVAQAYTQHRTDEGSAEFVKIVDFANTQGCAFVSPTGYLAGRAAARLFAQAANSRNRP